MRKNRNRQISTRGDDELDAGGGRARQEGELRGAGGEPCSAGAMRPSRRLAVQRRRRSSLAGDGCASSTPRRQGRADRKTYARKVFRVSRLKSLVFRKLASETISKPQPSPKRQCSHQALSSWLATTPTKGHPHPANPTAKIWKTRILRHNQPISFPKARWPHAETPSFTRLKGKRSPHEAKESYVTEAARPRRALTARKETASLPG